MAPPSLESLRGSRVLVTSRDPVYARSLETALRAQGAEVRLSDGDGDAWVGAPDLGRIDVLLVETHGLGDAAWALLERVRELSPMVEIVAISSEPTLEAAIQALRSGVYEILAYPVSSGPLVEAVAGASARKRAGELRMRDLDATGAGRGQVPPASTTR